MLEFIQAIRCFLKYEKVKVLVKNKKIFIL